jgi:hypothetical protein
MSKTPVVFDFDAIRGAANRDAPAAEPEILGLFREWQQAHVRFERLSKIVFEDEELDAMVDAISELEHRIAAVPIGDVRGFAVKAFIVASEWCGGRSDDGVPVLRAFRDSDELSADEHMIKGMVAALVEFLPELEPQCRPLLMPPAQIEEDEDAEAQP